jgi:hypothetical protein
MSNQKVSRRRMLGTAVAAAAGAAAGSKSAMAQAPQRDPLPWESQNVARVAPRDELVNLLEFEDEAKKKLSPAAFALIAGGDRALFERITLRPRMNVPVIDLDLSVNLFGDTHFTPILVAPMADQKRFHEDAELATAKGATCSQSADDRKQPIERRLGGHRDGGEAVVLVSGVRVRLRSQDSGTGRSQGRCEGDSDHRRRIAFRQRTHCQLDHQLVRCSSHQTGADGSRAHQGHYDASRSDSGASAERPGDHRVELRGLAHEQRCDGARAAGHRRCRRWESARAHGRRVSRGTDILKALAFGAQAVLLGRPVMWGLAAYGEGGVRSVVEMAQTELARYMGMCGKVNLKALDRTMVKVHAPIPVRTGSNN